MMPQENESISKIPPWDDMSACLQVPEFSKQFKIFLASEMALESILFWEAAQMYERKATELFQLMRDIQSNFISSEGEFCINIASMCRKDIIKTIKHLKKETKAFTKVFNEAKSECHKLLLNERWE